MNTTYTISTRDISVLAAQESFISFEPVLGGKVIVRPNEVYKDQVKQKLESQQVKYLKFTILFNLQRCINQYLSNLEIDKERTEQLTQTQLTTIDAEIQNIEDDITSAREELQFHNQEQNSSIQFREDIEKDLQYILCLMNENYRQELQEKMKQQKDAITREVTQISNRISKGQQNLQSARDLKVRLETEIKRTIEDCQGLFQILRDAQTLVKEYIKNVQLQLVEIYRSPDGWDPYSSQLDEHIASRSENFGGLLALQSKYYKVEQELTTYKKKIQLNVELARNETEYEAIKAEKPFIVAEIARMENKKQEIVDLLPALKAIDSIEIIQNCYHAINNNFEQVRTGRVRLEVTRRLNDRNEWEYTYDLINPTYHFAYPNVYNVKPSEETLAAEREIEYWNQQIFEKQNRITLEQMYENEIIRLKNEQANLAQKNQQDYDSVQNQNNELLKNLLFIIAISQRNIEVHEFEQASIPALLGCISQYMCIKSDPLFMCCRCCYSKDLHNYTDICYSDFVRVFIKQYRKNNNVGIQQQVFIQNIPRIRLEEVLDLLLDYEYVGAYRNQEGLRQNLQGDLRGNQIERSLTYNLFEVCNLYVIQEMIKLNFFTNIAFEERQRYENFKQQVEMGDLSAQNNPQSLTQLR